MGSPGESPRLAATPVHHPPLLSQASTHVRPVNVGVGTISRDVEVALDPGCAPALHFNHCWHGDFQLAGCSCGTEPIRGGTHGEALMSESVRELSPGLSPLHPPKGMGQSCVLCRHPPGTTFQPSGTASQEHSPTPATTLPSASTESPWAQATNSVPREASRATPPVFPGHQQTTTHPTAIAVPARPALPTASQPC